MAKQSRYSARRADASGFIDYSEDEHHRWYLLMQRQLAALPDCAAPVYLQALADLDLPRDRIPQCAEVSKKLTDATGWKVKPVPALIDFDTFFTMLSRREFPAASFIRSAEEMDYLQEPDIFHEILGHTPLLTRPEYAAFVQAYGAAGRRADSREQVWLARLFWFTVEFGLLRTDRGLRAFGAGIVSSSAELPYSIGEPGVERRPFDPLAVLRTPYRIDIMQPIYYVLDDLEQLFELARADLLPLVRRARALGLEPPLFERQSA